MNLCNAVVDETIGDLQGYRHLMYTPAKNVWETALSNDLGRLAQGWGRRCRKEIVRFVSSVDKPYQPTKKITYAILVAELRPHKKEVHRFRLIVGGNKLE